MAAHLGTPLADDVREALLAQEILKGVDFALIEPLLRDCPVRRLAPGEVLIAAGARNRELYFILKGALSVHLGAGEGAEGQLVEVAAGETVGELALIDGTAGSASVRADTACEVMAVDEEVVWLMANTSHAIATNLLGVLARRLRGGNDLIAVDRRRLREYHFRATVDGLTELFNRRYFDGILSRQMSRGVREGQRVAMLLIDIDEFKQVNDVHGHLSGDQVLREVASVLREGVRPLDLAARYGGEEFVVLCPATDLDGARTMADRLLIEIAALPISLPGEKDPLHVTVSIGIAESGPGRDTPEALIAAADAAMYRAKHAGRNQVSE